MSLWLATCTWHVILAQYYSTTGYSINHCNMCVVHVYSSTWDQEKIMLCIIELSLYNWSVEYVVHNSFKNVVAIIIKQLSIYGIQWVTV